MKLKNWYTSQEMSDICKKSTRTIERRRKKLLKENPDLDWFKTKSKPYKYSFKFMSEFISPELFDLIQYNRSLSNTIECMHLDNTLEQYLAFADWDYFITVTYKENKDKMECITMMKEIYKRIDSLSSGHTRIFYTTETFSIDKGNHNHMVLKSDLKLYEVRDLIEELEPVGIIDVQRYNYELAAIFYICKEWRGKNSGLYWDLDGSNLKEDGEMIRKIKDAINT